MYLLFVISCSSSLNLWIEISFLEGTKRYSLCVLKSTRLLMDFLSLLQPYKDLFCEVSDCSAGARVR